MPLDKHYISTAPDPWRDQGCFEGGYTSPDHSDWFTHPDDRDQEFYRFLEGELSKESIPTRDRRLCCSVWDPRDIEKPEHDRRFYELVADTWDELLQMVNAVCRLKEQP